MLEIAAPSPDLNPSRDPRGAATALAEGPGEARTGPTIADVQAELARRSLLRLAFPAAIEARYEAETKAARAWNIRLTVTIGLVAYLAFSAVDGTVLPDLGWVPTLMRVFVVLPVGLFAMWMATRLSAAFREAFIAYAATGTLLIPIAFIVVSRAPLAPYTTLVVLLVSMFGNITMRLRFRWACLFTFATVLAVALMLGVRPDLPGGLSGCIMIATVTCVSFGIVANNQLERAERCSYLLALRESLRADALGVDRAAFSALSRVDPLTGLANRRAFDARLEELWQSRQGEGRRLCLVMIDVDHFKLFNDRYGHPAGDACLIRVARALEAPILRQGDLVARYGGEEFAVILADCDAAGAMEIGATLCAAVAAAAIPHGAREDGLAVVTVSVGFACAEGAENAAILVALADRDLYAAKRAGRNRVGAFRSLAPGPKPSR